MIVSSYQNVINPAGSGQTGNRMRLPTVTAANLQREQKTLPQAFEGEFNIVFIPFQQWHQRLVDGWVPLARKLERQHPNVRYYELPTIQRLNRLSRVFINEGMRAGIPDNTARERTITLYLDKAAFRRALDLPSESTIYILVVDRAGHVWWRASGEYTPEKGEALAQALDNLLSGGI